MEITIEFGLFEKNFFTGDRDKPYLTLNQTDEDPFSHWRVRGQRLYDTGRLWQAAEAFLKVYRVQPDDAALCKTIADIYADLGRMEDATIFYLRAVTLLFFRGESGDALAVLEKLELLKPDDPGVLQIMAEVHLDIRKSSRYLDIISHHEQMAVIKLLALANLHLERQEEAAALVACQRVVDIDPRNAKAALMAARLLDKAGQTEAAFDLLEKTTHLLQRADMAQEAWALVEEAVQVAPGNRAFLDLLQAQRDALSSQERELNELERKIFRS